MSEFELGQEVYTEDGRKAEYAGEIDGQKFVRIVLFRDDEEYGLEEWPSDKLTPVSRVFKSAPMESHDKRVSEAMDRLQSIREEERAVRASVLDLRKQEKIALDAAAKFPEIQMALDFLEGRITHVVIEDYGSVRVVPLSEALTQYEDGGWGSRRENGLKLLCLFGHEKGKKPRWAINRYFDGSGSYITVDPFRSEEEARAEMQRRADAEFELWRSGEKVKSLGRWNESGVELPQDYLDHVEKIRLKAKSDKIEKLRAEISALEATP
tara:strand:- start:63 stop:863 length:801 start_codon:yes stop_codon:yes gene_type:complete